MKSASPTSLLGRSLRRLWARRRYVQRLKDVSAPPQGLGGAEWLLSRGLCRFGRFELAGIPKPQRRQAVSLQIRQWSPFSSTGSCAVMGDDAAYIWIWDKEVVDREVASAKLGRGRVHVIPETLLHGPEKNGSRLVKCLDGVEGQIWQNGTLTHSRWWPDAPDPARWNAFMRDSGQSVAASVPVARDASYAKAPWAPVDRLTNGETVKHERFLVVAGVSVLSAASVWFLVHSIQLSGRIEEEKNRLAQLEQSARPIQEARQQALDLRDRIEFLRGFDPYPAQTVLQAEVGRRLPKDGTFIKNWEFQAGRLKLTLVSPNKLQASSLVKIYQEAGWFKDVQAPSGSDPNLLVLEMSVLRLADVNPESAGASAGGEQPRSGNPPAKSS